MGEKKQCWGLGGVEKEREREREREREKGTAREKTRGEKERKRGARFLLFLRIICNEKQITNHSAL